MICDRPLFPDGLEREKWPVAEGFGAGHSSQFRKDEMATGILKAWIADRGFGFIKRSDGGDDIFMHVTALYGSGIDPDDLERGDHLAFDIGRDRDGRKDGGRKCSTA